MVQIRAKQERGVWASLAINSTPDLAIAAILAAYFGGGVLGFIAAYVGVEVLYLLLWLKRIGWGWLVYALWGKRRMVEKFEDYLYQNRFPRPPEFVGGIEEYLNDITEDNRMHPQTRVKAAAELGALAGIKLAGNHLLGMQLSFALEQALEDYGRRFPPRDTDDTVE